MRVEQLRAIQLGKFKRHLIFLPRRCLSRAPMFAVLVLLLLVLGYALQPAPCMLAQASTNEAFTDRDALLEFKANLHNPYGGGALVSWNTSDFCHWPGVTCSLRHRGRVSALNLSSVGLAGTIAPSIGNLTFLRVLDLSSNALQGEIPSTIGRLRRLEYLNFTGNLLHGGIKDDLSNCTGLVNIMLDKNQLTGEIPPWLGDLPNLVALILSKNNLTGIIPPSLGNASSMVALYVHTNQLEGTIPEELGRLNNLQWLALFANRLSGTIPETVFNLSSVVAFGVDQNDLHGTLPPNWGDNLPNLRFIFLGLNHFTGSVPASLANATGLLTLDLGSNNFTGTIPPAVGKLCPRILSLDKNQIEAGNMEDWEFITFLTNCTRLRVLSLQGNMLAGELPTSVANLTTQLWGLYFTYNKIRGKIPPGIGNLVGLQNLYLGHNLFEGSLPSTIGQLKMLQTWELNDNLLSGTIPHSLGNLTQLQEINFENNLFEGPLPVSIRNLQKLTAAHLSHNALTGQFPRDLFNLSSLSYILDLADNHFVGPLPPEVGSLTKLSSLHISRNNLSGSLPDTLSNCQSLVELQLDGNSFSGSLPESISRMQGLVVLNLTKNILSGVIPPQLGLMDGLQVLDLAHNNFSGQIPLSFGNMSSLYQFDISFNNLTGQVPVQGVFTNLTGFLFVSNGGLCGGIQELHLHACPEQPGQHSESKHQVVLKVTIPIGSLFFIIMVFLFFFFARKKWGAHSKTMATAAVPLMDDKYPRVSYAELVQGTDGFAAPNLIGRGRYGSVYKGRLSLKDAETVVVVAVKVFDLEQSGSSKSFVAECDALSKIRHRNLIRVITCCSSSDSKQNDFKALVFEFMPNQSLEKWLHPVPGSSVSMPPTSGLTLMQRLSIAVNVADALDYLHNSCQPAIVHCDLKPSNILLNEDFVACVGDFGLAKILSDPEDEQQLINSKSLTGIRGTIGYVAPEYGEGGQVSLCGDVFSFGVVLLEMFTGKAPTHDMFADGLTIQSYVETAFPDRLMDIVDPVLLPTSENYSQHISTGGGEISNAIIRVTRIAMACCKLTPSERISMGDAAAEMRKIRAATLHN